MLKTNRGFNLQQELEAKINGKLNGVTKMPYDNKGMGFVFSYIGMLTKDGKTVHLEFSVIFSLEDLRKNQNIKGYFIDRIAKTINDWWRENHDERVSNPG